jgi:hypothetical protein
MGTEHDHLAQAIHHIARAEALISEQRLRVQRMAEHGHSTELAVILLQTMCMTLDRMQEHRELIEKAIADGQP